MNLALIEALSFGLEELAAAAQSYSRQLGQPCRLFLLCKDQNRYQSALSSLRQKGLGAGLRLLEADTTNPAAVLSRLKQLKEQHGLDGIINLTDSYCQVALQMAEHFALPSQNAAAVALVRDKARFRSCLFEAGLSRGRGIHLTANSEEALSQIADQTGYPAIIKENSGTGSRNVWKVADASDCKAVWQKVQNACLQKLTFAVEPYFPGVLYSAEVLSWQGRHTILAFSGRVLNDFAEEISVTPVLFSSEKKITQKIRATLDAVGYECGFSHVEFILSGQTTTQKDTEEPKHHKNMEIVEVNPRLGGGLIGLSLCRAYGQNIYECFLDMALGQAPSIFPVRSSGNVSDFQGLTNAEDLPKIHHCSAHAMIRAEQCGTYQALDGLEELHALPGNPQFFPTARPGKQIEHLDDYRAELGMLYVCADSPATALLQLIAAQRKLKAVIV